MRPPRSTARVLVTGGAGFLGSHLCERLVDAATMCCASTTSTPARAKNIEHLLRIARTSS
jgi:nucleoside-diphosphate-sugar epimerase